MKAFLWHDISRVSGSWHQNGSVLIQAETLERARELATYVESSGYGENRKTKIEKMDIENEPDAIFECLSPADERIWVFPNAGCC